MATLCAGLHRMLGVRVVNIGHLGIPRGLPFAELLRTGANLKGLTFAQLRRTGVNLEGAPLGRLKDLGVDFSSGGTKLHHLIEAGVSVAGLTLDEVNALSVATSFHRANQLLDASVKLGGMTLPDLKAYRIAIRDTSVARLMDAGVKFNDETLKGLRAKHLDLAGVPPRAPGGSGRVSHGRDSPEPARAGPRSGLRRLREACGCLE